MTLNSSGPISLGGTTAGVSIEKELGGSGTTQISLNDSNVRTLAGVASGAITMPTNFYGKGSAVAYYYTNIFLTTGFVSSPGFTEAFNVDSSGNTYVVGNLSSNQSLFITKVNSTGTIQWCSNIVTNSFYNWGGRSVVDSSGNFYLCTSWTTTTSYVLFKFSSTGSLTWSYVITTTATAVVNPLGLVINSSGYIDVFSTGSNGTYNVPYWITFNSSGTIQGTSYKISAGSNSLVGADGNVVYDGTYYYSHVRYNSSYSTIIKFNTSGVSWATELTSYVSFNSGCVVDSSGNVYGAAAWSIGGTYEPVVFKLNSSGVLQASAAANFSSGNYSLTLPVAITIDSSNNIYIAFTINRAPSNLSQENYIVIQKFNSSLSPIWTRTLTTAPGVPTGGNSSVGPFIQENPRIAIDSTNNYFYIYGINDGQFINSTSYVNPSYFLGGYFVFKLPVDGSFGGNTLVVNNIPFVYGTSFASLAWSSTGTASTSLSGLTLSSISPTTATYTPPSVSTATLGSTAYVAPSFNAGDGSATYLDYGTYSWLCPSGVSSVSVVCIGAGGAGGNSNTSAAYGGSGGGGGGLGYINNYSVTAGNTYTVKVGQAGVAPSGGQSYFNSTSTVQGNGGSNGIVGSPSNRAGGSGGNYTGTGGGNGGTGGQSFSTNAYSPGGGGGAGGYSGNGGTGGAGSSTSSLYGAGGNPASGSGGGGGGASGNNTYAGAAGGGTNVIGKGPDGVGGSGGSSNGVATSGSYGVYYPYATYSNTVYGQSGFSPGGGGGGGQIAYSCCCGVVNPVQTSGGQGGGGIVRIIWPGSTRSFPSTNTGAP